MLSFKQQLILLIIFFVVLCGAMIFYKRVYYKKITFEEALKSPEIYLNYIQKYKIKNLWFTLCSTFIYFFSQIGLVFYLRLKTLGNANNYTPINIDYVVSDKTHIYAAISTSALLIITFVCFYVTLRVLFFDEVCKLHYYLLNKCIYKNIKNMLIAVYCEPFFGKFYLFFYNISKLRAYTNMDDYQEFYLYNTIFENAKIQQLSFQCVNLASKSKIIQYFFIILEWIFKMLYRHIKETAFIFYVPLCIYFVAIFYDFIHLKIYYTYYLFFPIYFILLLRQYLSFLRSKDHTFDPNISRYFYSKNAGKLTTSVEIEPSFHLYFNILNESVIKYILNDLYIEMSASEKILYKQEQALYRRVFITIICFIVSSYLIKKNIYSVALVFFNLQISITLILGLLFIVLVYASLFTFKLPKGDCDYDYTYFIYSRNHWLLFWATLIIHILIYIFFIVKPHLFIINKEIIAEYFGVQFVQYFTIEDKMKYFHEYFDHYMTAGNASDIVINTLTVYIEAIDINNIIVESTTMNDIKFFIDDLVENYVKHVTIIHAQYLEYLEVLAQKTWLLSYRDRLLNIINFYVFWNVIIMYLDAFSLVKVLPLDPRMHTLICAWIDLIIRNRR